MSRYWLLLIGFILLVQNPSLVIADPLCWLRTQSPQDAKIAGPIQLGPDWKQFKLTKPFQVAPSIQYIHVLLKRVDFDFVDLSNQDEHLESWNRWLPRNIQTGRVQLFDVRVHNSKLGWIDLVYSFTGSPTVNDEMLASLGFANHPDKNQYFYPQGSVIDEVHIRANNPVTIEAIWWGSPGYWKWPCRRWSEVPASEIMVPQR